MERIPASFIIMLLGAAGAATLLLLNGNGFDILFSAFILLLMSIILGLLEAYRSAETEMISEDENRDISWWQARLR